MHERRRIIALSAFAVIVISGIVGSVGVLHYALMSPGEDSWSHYEGGGMFITSAPSATGDWKAVVYASACTGHGDIYCKSGGGITRI
jgi:hypothetical protein